MDKQDKKQIVEYFLKNKFLLDPDLNIQDNNLQKHINKINQNTAVITKEIFQHITTQKPTKPTDLQTNTNVNVLFSYKEESKKRSIQDFKFLLS